MKKLLAFTLSLLLVFSLIPVALVSAAGTYTVATGEEFVTAMADTTGATITLTADIVVDSQIQLKSGGKSYSVDTQGFDITYANADPESTLPMFKFTQTWANTITFTNNTEDPVVFTNNSLGTWATSVANGNTMKFVGSGAYSFPQGVTGNNFAVEIGVNNSSTGTAFDGNITGENIVVRHRNGILNGDVNVGSFSGEVTNSVTKNVPEMTVNGDITTTGTVTLKRNTLYTINGDVVAGGSLTVQGATIPAGKTVQGKNVCITNQNNTTGASHIYADVTATNAFLGKAGTVYADINTDKIITLGGTYEGDITATSGDLFGGKFATDPTALAGVTVHADVTNDGTYYVLGTYTPVEIVSTGEKYANLTAAYNAAQEGDTIKLTGTLVHPGSGVLATIKKNDITLDLNGQTVTDLTDVVFNNTGNRFITVSGSNVSKFKLTSSNGKGKIVINGCTGGANQQIIRFENLNATEGADITVENFDMLVPNGTGEGNDGWRGLLYFTGTAAAENNITIKNVTGLCDYKVSNSNQVFSGIEIRSKANVTIENTHINSTGHALIVGTAGIVLNAKDSTFDAQKKGMVTISADIDATFDNCTFGAGEASYVNTLSVSGEGAKVDVTDSKFLAPISVSKAAELNVENCDMEIDNTNANPVSLTTGGQIVSFKDFDIAFVGVKQNPNNNYAAFTLTGADGANVVLDLENVTISEAYRVFRATNAYNEVSISNLAFAKTSATATFSANGNANVTVAAGEGYYVDEALTEEYADFAWQTTKGQTLYIKSSTPVVEPTTYDITVDGEVVATVEEGQTYTLPVLEAGKYYVGYEGVTEIVVTEDVNLTTATYTYDITVDGEVVATVEYGATFTLPAVAEGMQYVDGFVAGQEFTVTEALSFATEKIPEIAGEATEILKTQVGASIRLGEVNGIRFYTSLDVDKLNAFVGDKEYEVGTLIAPKDIAGDYLTIEDDCAKVVYDMSNALWANDEIVGSLVNIKEKNWARDFVARAYILVDGVYYYSDVQCVRNIAGIADAYIADEKGDFDTLDADVQAMVEAWAKAND